MRILAISDTHCQHLNIHDRVTKYKADVIIHTGDYTYTGTPREVHPFLEWFGSLPFKHKILLNGNHELYMYKEPAVFRSLLAEYPMITYLENSGTTINGVKFWGSPITPTFGDWAWMLPRESKEISSVWASVPDDVDILATHGPAFGILDQNLQSIPCGCRQLLTRVVEVKPACHIFGHIHLQGAKALRVDDIKTLFVNASTCTEAYKPKNPPVLIELDEQTRTAAIAGRP